jgi:hypothetical protein
MNSYIRGRRRRGTSGATDARDHHQAETTAFLPETKEKMFLSLVGKQQGGFIAVVTGGNS